MTDLNRNHQAGLARPLLPLDQAIAVCLHAKFGRSKSKKTEQAYRTTIADFRMALASVNLDLDGAPHTVALAAQGWADGSKRGPDVNVANATYNQRLAILSSFYSFARKRRLLDRENPIDPIDRRVVDAYAGAEALDERTIKRKLQAIDRTTLAGQRDYALLAVFLQTGGRLSEVAGLRWRALAIDESTLSLRFPRTKGGR